MNKKILASICLLNLGVFSSYGQIVNFTGYGRAQVDNNQFITGDSVNGGKNPKKEVGKSTRGYTLFDLGINASPNENFRASVILRLRNEFGGFFGNGSSFAFRQMRLEGKIAKVVKYEIGDIDLGLSKYTLYNNDDMWCDYESDIFKLRRDIVNYENFYNENKWRLQGVNLNTNIAFKKGIEKVGLQVFGTRTKPSNFFTSTDRFLYGGKLSVVQGKFGEIVANGIVTRDFKQTAISPSYLYNIANGSVQIKPKADLGALTIAADAELGWSGFNYTLAKADTADILIRGVNDMFYDANVSVKYNPLGIKLYAGYKQVGLDYYAPGAQTLRVYNTPEINGSNGVSIFNTYVDGSAIRNIHLFDRISQESYGGMYNNAIQTTLLPYLPQYNNATPYGDATANRKGLYVGLTAKDSAGIYDISAKYQSLKEISAEGSLDASQTRAFTVLTVGGKINVNKIFKIKRGIALNGGLRTENTERSGANPIKLNNQQIDAGVELEAFKNFYVLGGYKAISSKGNEYLFIRNVNTNEFQDIKLEDKIDLKQSIASVGIKYNFNKNNIFSATLNVIDNKGSVGSIAVANKQNYNFTQLYFVYVIKF
ncbi:MAG: hypothetical protein U0V72_04760 [Cytophagales bacterium]